MNFRKIVKKTTGIFTAILALSLIVTGCGSQGSSSDASNGNQQPKELVVATWGGSYEKGLAEIVKPFEEQYNCKVILDIGNNADRLNKLRAQKGNPQIDVAFMTDYFAAKANAEGIFDKINPDNIPNLKNVYDFAVNKDNFGPAYCVASYGIAYNTEEVSEAPDSWMDLWDPQYKDNISIADISGTSGVMMLAMAARLNGADEHNIDVGFEKIKELKPNIVNYYVGTSDVLNMFERKEIVMSPFMDIFMPDLKKSGLPIEWALPKEGGWAVINTLNVTKGSKNKELAEQFINFMLDENTQKQIAETIFDGPVNVNTKLDPDLAETLTYGKEKIESLIVFDWDYINSVMDEWVERWNKEITGN